MEDHLDNIERYLLGELHGTELEAFEKAFESNPSLAESVAKHRELIVSLDTLRLRNKVKTIISPLGKAKSGFRNIRIIVIAVTLGLLIVIGFFVFKPDKKAHGIPEEQNSEQGLNGTHTEKNMDVLDSLKVDSSKSNEVKDLDSNKATKYLILASTFLINPVQILTRDMEGENSPSENSSYNEAKNAFEKKNYELALKKLQKIKMNQSNEDALLIRAHSYFKIGRFEDAAIDFKSLQSSFQYKHEGKWNFLLCQLSLSKIELTKSMLNDMIANKDFPYRSNAKELKSKLNF